MAPDPDSRTNASARATPTISDNFFMTTLSEAVNRDTAKADNGQRCQDAKDCKSRGHLLPPERLLLIQNLFCDEVFCSVVHSSSSKDCVGMYAIITYQLCQGKEKVSSN
jgi:hypothetical protein